LKVDSLNMKATRTIEAMIGNMTSHSEILVSPCLEVEGCTIEIRSKNSRMISVIESPSCPLG
jgi:hypothetical protein